jgi:hypothetical protein
MKISFLQLSGSYMQIDGLADMTQQIGPSFATLHIPTRFIVSDMTVHTEETNTFSAFFFFFVFF